MGRDNIILDEYELSQNMNGCALFDYCVVVYLNLDLCEVGRAIKTTSNGS